LIVIPAIDLKDGRCVRLKQGRMSDETVFSDVPEEMAVRWYEQGAERLHLVDLNGAVQGEPVNMAAIKRIVASIPIPVELGGGIRDMPTLEAHHYRYRRPGRPCRRRGLDRRGRSDPG